MYQPFWVLWLVLTWTNWRVLPLASSRSTAHFAACWLFLSLSTATMVVLSFPSSGSPLCDAVEKAERHTVVSPVNFGSVDASSFHALISCKHACSCNLGGDAFRMESAI